MIKINSVDEFISLFPERKKGLELLRSIALSTGMEEGVKWSAPIYMVKGKNVMGLLAFNEYIGIWFHQGCFLKDEANVLINAQEGVTKALRQWRFSTDAEIDPDLVKAYILEAIENELAGKRLKPEKKSIEMPKELTEALKADPDLNTHFHNFTEYKRKEFAEYIGSAKREATRVSRLQKCIPMIMEGVGLNDKYR